MSRHIVYEAEFKVTEDNLREEDGGMAIILEPDERDETVPDDNLFVRVQSWDDNKIHPTMSKMKGKKVVVTVRVED